MPRHADDDRFLSSHSDSTTTTYHDTKIIHLSFDTGHWQCVGYAYTPTRPRAAPRCGQPRDAQTLLGQQKIRVPAASKIGWWTCVVVEEIHTHQRVDLYINATSRAVHSTGADAYVLGYSTGSRRGYFTYVHVVTVPRHEICCTVSGLFAGLALVLGAVCIASMV